MIEFKSSRRDLCVAMIGRENYILSLTEFIKENLQDPSEQNIAKIVASIQKNLITPFRDRFNKCGRNKDQFLRKNAAWLNGIFAVSLADPKCEPSSSSGKLGRPVVPYDESSNRTKKRKNMELIHEYGLNFVSNSYIQGLRSEGETDEAFIVQSLRSLSREQKKRIRNNFLQENNDLNRYSNDEALSIYIDLDLTKAQYEFMRKCLMEKRYSVFPTYNFIREAKSHCYPPQSSMEITNIGAKVALQDLLDHTASRILMIDSVYKTDATHLKLFSKWGLDGSSGQSEYKQVLPGESELVSDANLFICSIVPIRLVNVDSNEILWENPAASSVRFCRPISIEFCKETPQKTKSVTDEMNSQISALSPSLINRGVSDIEVKHELFLTMVDGKVTQVLTDTSSTAVCIACGAKPREMNDLNKVKTKPENENAFQYGLSTLHSWIRFMELILHISYNLNFQKWSATTPDKKLKEERKKHIQQRFREELGLIIDKPRQGTGNSNDGNTARRFFQNYTCTSNITGVDEELIKRFYVILQVMSSGKMINATKFGQYALDTAQLYVDKYIWYYMPSSVHKVLIHGENIIRHYSLLPLGQLSEDAQESRNKDYKRYRLDHSRKCSRVSTNEDVFHTLLYTSDPYITSLRKPYRKMSKELLDEAVNLLNLSE